LFSVVKHSWKSGERIHSGLERIIFLSEKK
jgi:hypothetical protein